MSLYNLKPQFQKVLSPLSRQLVSFGAGPTLATTCGFVASLSAALVFYFSIENNALLYAIPFLLFIRIACNALDGMMARSIASTNHTYGEMLNEISDRVSDLVIFSGLLFTGYVSLLLFWTTIVLMLLSSYLGILGKAAGGTRRYEGPMGKADRMLYLSIMSVVIGVSNNYIYADYTLWFISAGLVITIVRRFFKMNSELSS